MPREYTRKTTWGKASLEEMEKAAAEVKAGQKSLRDFKDKNIDKSSLQRFIKKKERKGKYAKRILTDKMEEDLTKHLKELAGWFHGLNPLKCRQLAFEYANKNNIPVPDNWTMNQCAGESWFASFRAHRRLSFRTPEATSLGRATAFNRTTVGEFFDNLAAVTYR
uniref:HTH CENPB-type domain-containing protein n=1 Tax=Salarias fasciatus TaxID=181472 RepID=A0A672IK21_SALFA